MLKLLSLLLTVMLASSAHAFDYTCTAAADAGNYAQELKITDNGIWIGGKQCGRLMDDQLPYVYLCGEGNTMTGVMIFNPANYVLRYSVMRIGQHPNEVLGMRYLFRCQKH